MELDSEESEWFHFLPVLPMTPRFMIQWKLDCWSRKQKGENWPNKMSVLVLRPFQYSLPHRTATIQFSVLSRAWTFFFQCCQLNFLLVCVALCVWLRLSLQLCGKCKPALNLNAQKRNICFPQAIMIILKVLSSINLLKFVHLFWLLPI